VATHIPSITRLKGSAVMIAPVCRAVSPPASSSPAATTPSIDAHSTLLQVGGSGFPPEASMSTTSEPESDEVTKKIVMRKIARTDSTDPNGRPCKTSKRTFSGMMLPSLSSSPPGPSIWRKIAVPPRIENHKKVTSVGTRRTPATNSRIVLPREMRAMKTPTNGAHDIHQPQ